MNKPFAINEKYVFMLAALGGFLFGYDWVLIGGAKPFYERFFHITDSTLYHMRHRTFLALEKAPGDKEKKTRTD